MNNLTRVNTLSVQEFPLAGKTTYTAKDYDRLLKRALMHQYDAVRTKKKSRNEEIASDTPTLYLGLKSIYQAVKSFIEGDIPKSINILSDSFSLLTQSGAGIFLIDYFRRGAKEKKDFFKYLLKLRHDLEKNIEDPGVSVEEAYKKLENDLRNRNDLELENLSNYDLRHFSPKTFDSLHQRYNTTLYRRASRALKTSPKIHARFANRNAPRRTKELAQLAFNFLKGVGKNVQNPHKFRTPIAFGQALWSAGKISVYLVKQKAQGFDPFHKQLHILKKEYRSSPAVLDHWEKTLQLEDSIKSEVRKAAVDLLALSSASYFVSSNLSDAIYDSFNQAAAGNYTPLLVNLWCLPTGIGPLRDAANSLQDSWIKINSDLSKLVLKDMRLHEDKIAIQKHKNVKEGFESLAM